MRVRRFMIVPSSYLLVQSPRKNCSNDIKRLEKTASRENYSDYDVITTYFFLNFLTFFRCHTIVLYNDCLCSSWKSFVLLNKITHFIRHCIYVWLNLGPAPHRYTASATTYTPGIRVHFCSSVNHLGLGGQALSVIFLWCFQFCNAFLSCCMSLKYYRHSNKSKIEKYGKFVCLH